MNEIDLRAKVQEAKRRVLELVVRAGHGHPTSAFSCAEIVATLYYNVMHYRVDEPDWADRDRFIMSKNHASIMLYPILNDLGFILNEEYKTIMMEGSSRTYHTNIDFPGMEFTGGALGIGLGFAAGIAHAALLERREFLTFCLVGDAECCEGSIWETVMYAAHNHLHNLVAIVDQNNMGITDYTSNMIQMEPIEDKWRAFGWEARRVNGHDLKELEHVFADVRTRSSDKPLVIVADTLKGKGVELMENKLLWHGNIPKGEQVELVFQQLAEEVLI